MADFESVLIKGNSISNIEGPSYPVSMKYSRIITIRICSFHPSTEAISEDQTALIGQDVNNFFNRKELSFFILNTRGLRNAYANFRTPH